MSTGTSNAQKYETGNPLVRALLSRFLDTVVDEVRALQPRRVVDLGCGEGYVAERLARMPGLEYRGFDLNPDAVRVARERVPGLRAEAGDILRIEPDAQWADVAICLEVLEHLESPRDAMRRIRAWTRGSAVLSVPWEPYFRMGNLLRGKHLKTWGNLPEHLQQFGPASFEALIRTEFEHVRVRTSFPWLLAVASV